MRARPIAFPFVLLLVSAVLCACGDPVARLRAPGANVLLVTVDTLRADHLGCYGYARETSPNLDAFAVDAVRFEAAFSPRGLTFPAIASLLTSKHVYSHGVVRMHKVALPQSHETLAETLAGLGYRTAEFNSHLGFFAETGFHQGFDEFRLFHSDDEPKMVEAALAWLSDHRSERFFVWVHSFGPHSPYQAPEPWRSRFTDPDYAGPFDGAQKPLYQISLEQKLSAPDREHIVALYDGKLAWIDEQLGVLLRGIDELGLREDTLVIVTADHGEELFDHHLFFGHESSIYHGVLRVPLLMRLPGRLPAGTIAGDRVVELIDVFPTVLDVLGQVPGPELQGQSLLPVIAGVSTPDAAYAFATVDHDKVDVAIRTIRSPRWRYIENPDRYMPWNVRVAERELYDLEADPGERHNVVGEHPEVVAELQRELGRWFRWTRLNATQPDRLVDGKVQEQLEALGYLETQPGAGQAAPSAP